MLLLGPGFTPEGKAKLEGKIIFARSIRPLHAACTLHLIVTKLVHVYLQSIIRCYDIFRIMDIFLANIIVIWDPTTLHGANRRNIHNTIIIRVRKMISVVPSIIFYS